MAAWSQLLRYFKKHLGRLLSFLFLLAVSWYVWGWMVPPRPRAILTPFIDSEFVAFTFDVEMLITREPQWQLPPGEMNLRDMGSRPSRIQLWDTHIGILLITLSGESDGQEYEIPTP